MNKSKIKNLLTGKIGVGILCFILGGLFMGTTPEVDITTERYNQLLEIERNTLGLDNTKNPDNTDNTEQKNNTEADKNEDNIFNQGETAYLVNDDGVNVLSLTINSAKFIDDRNQFSDKEAKKVVEIEYTYENLGSDENIRIFDSNFKIYDNDGNVLESYPAGADKHPQAISKGKKCTAEMSFAVNNDSNNLEIEYYDNMFSDKANGIFTITVE